MKKVLYSFIILFILLVIAIVVAANSSFVIKKVADIFAPDYKISYDDITGNVFNGVKITGLKFDGKHLAKDLEFLWNPAEILFKRVAIDEIIIDDINEETMKSLIASFPKSTKKDDNSTFLLPVVITVDKVHLSAKPFVVQEMIAIEKTVLDAEDITYGNNEVSVDKLFLKVDSNVTDLVLYASLNDSKLVIEELGVKNIDSVTLEKIFLSKVPQDKEAIKESKGQEKSKENTEEINPLIPKKVELKHFVGTLKPRSYKTATVDKLEVTLAGVDADIIKILKNDKNALIIRKYSLDLQSDMAQVDLEGDLRNSIVTLDKINIKKVDTLLIQTFFANKDNTEYDMDSKKEASKKVVKEVVKEKVKTGYENQNNLIPTKVFVKSLHTDVLPATYDPVHILNVGVDVEDAEFDVRKILLEKAVIAIDGQTNLTNFTNKSTIKNNKLIGHIVLIPNHKLFEMYNLPLRKEAIGDIGIDVNASKNRIVAKVDSQAKNIFILPQDNNATDSNVSDSNKTKEFTVDIDDLKSTVEYVVASHVLKADTKIMITTPYAKDISVSNTFLMDKNITYSGEIKAAKIIGLDAKMVRALNDFMVKYDGSLNNVNTQISAEGLKGSFVSSDMKNGLFHLETKEAIKVAQLVTLPPELNATKVNVLIDAPINFNNLSAINGKAKITSNVANVDADIVYGKEVKAKITTTIPKDSLLINFDKNVHYEVISPLVTNITVGKKDIKVNVSSKKINANVMMKPFAKTVDGKIHIAGMSATLKAKPNGDIAITSDVGSFTALLDTVQQFYSIDRLPKVEGKLNASVLIKKNTDVTFTLTSPQVIYHADRKTDHEINDLKIVLGKKGDNISLNSYQLDYNGLKFFARKPSILKFNKEGNIVISELWLNDQLKVTGNLDTKKMKGQILADAPTFHLAHKMIDLDSAINIKTVLDGNSTNIDGKVTLLGGDIHYDLAKKTFPSDSDIVIVQDMKKKEPSPFMDNLTIAVNIDTKKPLIFKQGPVDIQAKVNAGVHKAIFSDPMVIGSVDLVDGGSYVFQEKRFVLENSHVYFTGDPNKPMLDITVKYKTIKNSLITINITGTPAAPNILFSSVPSMSKEQILSIILFDSEEGAGTNSGNDMMKMMGGAMAKSVLSNLGVKIDHLVIGEGNSVEVGKKISDKTTIIYINGDIPEMKVKYDYSPSIEAVVGASERSESADIIYKKDFSADDIVIFGR